MQPNNLDARFFRALLLADTQKTDEALKEALEGLKLDSKNPLWYSILARIYCLRGEFDEGIKAANRGLTLDAKCPQCLYIRGGLYYYTREYARCVEDLNQYLSLRPLAGMVIPEEPYIVRGVALLMLDRPNDAIGNFLMARALNPKSIHAVMGLYNVYRRLEKWHLAAKYAQEKVQMDPKDPEGYNAWAYASSMVGNEKDAIQQAEKALACCPLKGPERATTLAAIGDVYVNLEKYGEALRYFDTALDSDAECFAAMRAKASLLATCPDAKLRNGTEALKLALKADADKYVIKFETAMLIAQGYAECGEFDKAVEFAKKAIKLAGENAYSKEECQRKLSLFEKKTPYRVPNKKADK